MRRTLIFTIDAVMIAISAYVVYMTHGLASWCATALLCWFSYGLGVDIRRVSQRPVGFTINDQHAEPQDVYDEFGEDGIIRMQFLWTLAQTPLQHYRIKRIEVRDGDPVLFRYTLRWRHYFANKDKIRWNIQKAIYAELKEFDLTDLKFEVEVARR